MKKLLAVVVGGLLSVSGYAQDLTVKVDGIKSTEGFLYVSLHNTDKTWMTAQPPVQGQKLPMSDKTMTVVFKDIPEGDYAVMLYQDKNDNGQIDKNTLGIPSEPYGFSNNGGAFGPPGFKDSSVNLKENTEITIYLQ